MRIFLSIVFAFIFTQGALAQRGNQAWTKYRHEVSIGYGFNTFLAGIGNEDQFGVRYALQRSTFNGSYRYFFLKHFAVRGSLTHGYSRKNDKVGDHLDEWANVDYEMTLTELAVMGEYHIFDETTKGRGKGRVRRARGGMSRGLNLGVSVFAGLAVDRFRPLGETQGTSVILRPYTTDAGSAPVPDYPKTHLHVPVGAHVRIIANSNWRVGFEGGYRLGFREYINNVSSVYYVDPNPYARTSEFEDTQFTGKYTTIDRDESQPLATLAAKKGRSGYFFGLVTLAYRIKS